MDTQKTPWQKFAFLVPPNEAKDWRMVYALGPAAPEADATAVLRHHARAIRNWGDIVERVPGGDSHTEDEFRRWFDQAGYRFVATQQLRRRPEWLLFASPANS